MRATMYATVIAAAEPGRQALWRVLSRQSWEKLAGDLGTSAAVLRSWLDRTVPRPVFRERLEAVAGIPMTSWGPAPGMVTEDVMERRERDPLEDFGPGHITEVEHDVVEPGAIRRPGQRFRCPALGLAMAAATCAQRQAQAAVAVRAWGKGGPCASCSTGAKVVARLRRA